MVSGLYCMSTRPESSRVVIRPIRGRRHWMQHSSGWLERVVSCATPWVRNTAVLFGSRLTSNPTAHPTASAHPSDRHPNIPSSQPVFIVSACVSFSSSPRPPFACAVIETCGDRCRWYGGRSQLLTRTARRGIGHGHTAGLLRGAAYTRARFC